MDYSSRSFARDVAKRALGVSDHGMPRGPIRARALVGAHIARKAFDDVTLKHAPLTEVLRNAFGHLVFLEMARRNMGPESIIRGKHGFFPHIFMPSYHGSHFDEAMMRLAFPKLGPNILYFSITGACPCSCEYCFARAGGEAVDVGHEPTLRVAREIAAQNVPLVNISGGEPLSRFERLVESVRILSKSSEVRMFTSGIGLNDARLSQLEGAGLTGVFVSLDTTNPDEFDRARGYRGAFAAATRGLARCAEADMLTFINCVVGPSRFKDDSEIAAFLDFVAQIDARIVVNFLPQLATGRGSSADSFRHPSECEGVADRIIAVARNKGQPVGMLFGPVDRYMGCPGAGGKLLNVDIEGNVTVCISRASLGNILDEPFETIYGRYVQRCHRLKVGFFCSEVSSSSDDELLAPAQSQAALERFFRDLPDSEWQRTLDRFGWLLHRLAPPARTRESAPKGGQ